MNLDKNILEMYREYHLYDVKNLEKVNNIKTIIFNYLSEFVAEKGLKLNYPLLIGLNFGDNCNLNCYYCFASNRQHDIGKFISKMKSNLEIVIAQLDEIKPLEIYLTGGEVFLYKELVYRAIQAIKDKGISLGIFTNGTLITNQDIIFMRRYLDQNDYLQITFDVVNQSGFIKYKKGSPILYKKVINVTKKILRNKINVIFNVPVGFHNVNNLLDIYKIAEKLGVNGIRFSAMFEYNRNNRKVAIYPNDYVLLRSFIAVYVYAKSKGFPVDILQDPIAVPYPYLSNFKANNMKIKKYYLCPAGKSAFEIDLVSGETYPCPFLYFKPFSGGNIMNKKLLEIWRESWTEFIERRKKLKYPCNKCQFNQLCKGACPAAAYQMWKTIHKGDPRCLYIKKNDL